MASRCGWRILLEILVVAALMSSISMGCLASEGGALCGASVLPRAARAAVETRFPGWKVEDLQDLNTEHKSAWLGSHPKECPGAAQGSFNGSGRPSFAILLIPKKGGEFGYKLIHAEERGQDYDTQVLEEASESAHYVVVSRIPPGDYYDSGSEENVTLTFDGILLETMDVGMKMYLWRDGAFHSFLPSE